jgi:hypothetical protein
MLLDRLTERAALGQLLAGAAARRWCTARPGWARPRCWPGACPAACPLSPARSQSCRGPARARRGPLVTLTSGSTGDGRSADLAGRYAPQSFVGHHQFISMPTLSLLTGVPMGLSATHRMSRSGLRRRRDAVIAVMRVRYLAGIVGRSVSGIDAAQVIPIMVIDTNADSGAQEALNYAVIGSLGAGTI